MSGKTRSACLVTVTKLTVVVLCFTAFFLNSYRNMQEFSKGETTLVTKIVNLGKKLKFPSITFCNEDGFRSTAFHTNLSKYMDNSYDVDEFFVSFGSPFLKNYISSHNTTRVLYSTLRGRCYVYEYPDDVGPFDTITFTLRDNVSLLIYAHEPGEDVWLNFFFIPEAFTVVRMESDTHLIDYQLQKEVSLDQQDCRKGWTSTDYAACIRQEFRREYDKRLATGLLPNCTTPWVQSMLGRLDYEDRPCDMLQSFQQAQFYEPFTIRAATYESDSCKFPCERARYKIEAEKYTEISATMYDKFKAHDSMHTLGRNLYVLYATTDVVEFSNKYIMTVNTFISTIGGNLGLFLGFSCVSVLFYSINRMSIYVAQLPLKVSRGQPVVQPK